MKKLSSWMTTITPVSKITAAVLFITLPFLGFYLGTLLPKDGMVFSLNASLTPRVPVVRTTPVVTTTVVSTTKAVDPYAGWNNNYIDKLDINIKASSSWKVTTLKVGGSLCNQEAKIKEFYKSNYICKDGTTHDYTQYFTIIYNDKSYTGDFKSTDPKNYIRLTYYASTDGGGDGCRIDCPVMTTSKISINGQFYDYTKKEVPFEGKTSLVSGVKQYLPAGNKSVYSKYSLGNSAVDESIYNEEVKIIQSITQN